MSLSNSIYYILMLSSFMMWFNLIFKLNKVLEPKVSLKKLIRPTKRKVLIFICIITPYINSCMFFLLLFLTSFDEENLKINWSSKEERKDGEEDSTTV